MGGVVRRRHRHADDAERLAARREVLLLATRSATVAGETVQLHGGIAITWEHDAHLVFKRAHALGQLFGSAARAPRARGTLSHGRTAAARSGPGLHSPARV